MSFVRDMKRRAKSLIAPAVFLAVTAYFVVNATQGDRGLVARAQKQELLKLAQKDELDAEAEHDLWAKRVAGLKSSHLDPDTLDERARFMLNLAEPNEVIVKLGPQEKLY